jgi:hypothetical protein
MYNSILMSALIYLAYTVKIHSMPMFFVVYQIILFTIVFVSYRFFEMPFLNMKESFSIIPSGTEVSKTGKILNSEGTLPIAEQNSQPVSPSAVQVQPAFLPDEKEQKF